MNLKRVACAALVALLPLTAAAAGALDPSFGTAGRASFDFTPTAQQGERGSAVAIRSDGKLVVVSETDGNPARVVVSRHNTNGTRDTTFGTNGHVVLDFGACSQCAVTSPSFALLANGTLVVAASEVESTLAPSTRVSNIAVTRLASNGSVDLTFGLAGVARINPAGHSIVYDLAVQSDGGILLAGSTGPSGLSSKPNQPPTLPPARWLVARLTAAGQPDAGFVDRANSSPDLAAPSAAQRIRVQSDGRIVVAGKTAQGLRGFRYSTQATEVRGFAWSIRGDLTDLAVDSLDRVWALAGGNQLVRFNSNLAVDGTFIPPALPRDSFFVSVQPLASGEAFVAGGRGFVAPQGTGVTVAGTVVKVGPAGQVDEGFGDRGRLGVDHALINRLALQSNGRVVAAGSQDPAADSGVRLALLRIDPATTPFVANEWLDFPIQSLGTRSAPQLLSITNPSSSSRTVSVTAPANFAIQGCSGSLAAGATCQLSVTHQPTGTPAALGFMDYATAPVAITDSGGRSATVQLYSSAERSLVQHFYRSILRRDADPGGWDYWNAEARRLRAELDALSGATGTATSEAWFAMAMVFFSSPEYAGRAGDDTAYVTDLFRTFFDRAPDTAGLGYWRDQLAQGLPREMVLNAFLFSTEFANFNATYFGGVAPRPEADLVMDMYRGLLGRLPDAGALGYWVPRMQRAQCQGAAAVHAEADTLSKEFAGGSEYTTRGRDDTRHVTDLYNAFLRRAGDTDGFKYWKTALESGGINREQARRAFLGSAEFSARVQRVISAGCRTGG